MSSGGDSPSAVGGKPYCYECAKLGRVCSKSREELERVSKSSTAGGSGGGSSGGVCECKHAVSDHRTTTELPSGLDSVPNQNQTRELSRAHKQLLTGPEGGESGSGAILPTSKDNLPFCTCARCSYRY